MTPRVSPEAAGELLYRVSANLARMYEKGKACTLRVGRWKLVGGESWWKLVEGELQIHH